MRFSTEQEEIISYGAKLGLDTKYFAKPEYSPRLMLVIIDSFYKDIDKTKNLSILDFLEIKHRDSGEPSDKPGLTEEQINNLIIENENFKQIAKEW